ncbi:hypothetical protein QR680_013632 [Steinernema hermaphroditum]|uniref:Cytochrome b5 heme-binding domain-containing protein n=1 Tax=Steinernema hermaphroditum TaxID=289476 RepID=A0AA39I659_9BILA|nr:hypothetical protein QR680_013632 [Steinernema hermaphroditum]
MVDFAAAFEITFTDVLLLVFLAYFIYYKFIKQRDEEPVQHARKIEPLPKQDMTLEALRKYDGVQDDHILLAICGKIYDMTRGRAFYGPDGPYKKLAGHDATRALGTMDVEKVQDTWDDLDGMTEAEVEEAREWAGNLSAKYPLVGKLIKEGEEKEDYGGALAQF